MDNVINLRDIETSSGNIGTDQNTSFTVDKFEKRGSTLLLFLLAVNRKDLYMSELTSAEDVSWDYRKINIVQ